MNINIINKQYGSCIEDSNKELEIYKFIYLMSCYINISEKHIYLYSPVYKIRNGGNTPHMRNFINIASNMYTYIKSTNNKDSKQICEKGYEWIYNISNN